MFEKIGTSEFRSISGARKTLAITNGQKSCSFLLTPETSTLLADSETLTARTVPAGYSSIDTFQGSAAEERSREMTVATLKSKEAQKPKNIRPGKGKGQMVRKPVILRDFDDALPAPRAYNERVSANQYEAETFANTERCLRDLVKQLNQCPDELASRILVRFHTNKNGALGADRMLFAVAVVQSRRNNDDEEESWFSKLFDWRVKTSRQCPPEEIPDRMKMLGNLILQNFYYYNPRPRGRGALT